MAKARAIITDELKQIIIADFNTGGYTQRELAAKHKISKSAVNSIVVGLNPKNVEIVAKYSVAKEKMKVAKDIMKVATDNMDMTNKEMDTINREVDKIGGREADSIRELVENTGKLHTYFKASAIKIQQHTMGRIDEGSSLPELRDAANITAKNKETIFGKDPTAIINNTNAQQTNITLDDFYDAYESDE